MEFLLSGEIVFVLSLLIAVFMVNRAYKSYSEEAKTIEKRLAKTNKELESVRSGLPELKKEIKGLEREHAALEQKYRVGMEYLNELKNLQVTAERKAYQAEEAKKVKPQKEIRIHSDEQ